MESIEIGRVDVSNEAQLQQVAQLLFGTTESWEFNISNNTVLGYGHSDDCHLAAIIDGRIVAYADCEFDGSLLQSAGPEHYRVALEGELLQQRAPELYHQRLNRNKLLGQVRACNHCHPSTCDSAK